MIYRHAGPGRGGGRGGGTAELLQAEASCVQGPSSGFAVGGGGLKLVWGELSILCPHPLPTHKLAHTRDSSQTAGLVFSTARATSGLPRSCLPQALGCQHAPLAAHRG